MEQANNSHNVLNTTATTLTTFPTIPTVSNTITYWKPCFRKFKSFVPDGYVKNGILYVNTEQFKHQPK